MHVSHIAGTKDHTITRAEDLSWDDLVRFLRTPFPKDIPKPALPLWSPAAYANGYTNGANIREVYAVGFDVDEDPIPDEAAIRRSVVWQAVAHTTPSATAKAPRWRLVIALSRAVTATEYRRIWTAIAGQRLGFKVGPASKDPSRGWYAPRFGTDESFTLFTIDAPPLDVDDVLRWAPPAFEMPTGTAGAKVNFATELPERYDARARDVGAALKAACPAVGANGGRHALSLTLAGAVSAGGLTWRLPDELVPAFVLRACEEAGFGALEQKWKNAADTIAKKHAGIPVKGFAELCKTFPAVAAAVDPYHIPAQAQTIEPPPDDDAVPLAGAVGAPTIERTRITSGFVGVPASELSKPLPPLEYILRHFGVARGRPTLLSGYGGLGKTIIAQALALHMASGRSQCWGLNVQCGPVWHQDYEMTLPALQRRYQRLAFGHGIDLAACRLSVCSMPSIYLSDDAAEDELCRACDGYMLGVMDNLAAATASSQVGENEAGIRHYLDRLIHVTERTGCHFLVLAHEKKSIEAGVPGIQKVRGSSAITDACGSVIAIAVDHNTGMLTLSQQKSSVRQKGSDVCLKFEDVEGERPRMPDDDPAGLRVVRDFEAEANAVSPLESTKRAALKVLRNVEVNREPAIRNVTALYDLMTEEHGAVSRLRKRAVAELIQSGSIHKGPPISLTPTERAKSGLS